MLDAMVEQVARALCIKAGVDPDERVWCGYQDLHDVAEGGSVPDVALNEPRWALRVKEARASLHVVREALNHPAHRARGSTAAVELIDAALSA